MLRTVPYLCILDGVGLVALWDLAGKLRSPLHTLPDRLGTITRVRLWSYAERLLPRTVFGGLMIAWGGYVFLHPYCDPWACVPFSAFLEHVNELIPENDAVIISNCNPFYVEHFLITNSARMLVPLDRRITGADFFVQWKKPPHPEWINEDFPDRSRQGLWVMYKRMRRNGGQFIFPYTVLDDLDVIESALRAGRKVYFVAQMAFTDTDFLALGRLIRHTDLQFIVEDFEPSDKIPVKSQLSVLRVAPLNSLDTKLRFSPEAISKLDELEK